MVRASTPIVTRDSLTDATRQQLEHRASLRLHMAALTTLAAVAGVAASVALLIRHGHWSSCRDG